LRTRALAHSRTRGRTADLGRARLPGRGLPRRNGPTATRQSRAVALSLSHTLCAVPLGIPCRHACDTAEQFLAF